MNSLAWNWIGLELTLPPIVALALAYPLWLRQQAIFGNLLGTAVLFGAGIGLILREYAEIDRVVQGCFDQGIACFPHPPAFTRFAVYAFIALAEVIVLFLLSLRVEERVRRHGYAPEWR